MVHDANEYTFKSVNKDLPYYFTIKAVNKCGVSARTPVVLAKQKECQSQRERHTERSRSVSTASS